MKKLLSVLAVLLLFYASAFAGEKEIFSLNDNQIDIAQAALIIAKDYYSDIDVNKYQAQLNFWAEDIKKELEGSKDPYQVGKVISEYFFVKEKIEYEKGASFLNQVLDARKANCLGGSILYLAIAERLGLPFYGVNAAEHDFVRFDDGKTKINFETTDKGNVWSDEQYINRISDSEGILHIPQSSLKRGVYLKNLTKKEVLADLLIARGKLYAETGRSALAIRDYNTALEIKPLEPIAYNNLANVYCLKGDYDKAMEYCNKALDLNPEFGKAYCQRGLIWGKKGEFTKAAADFTEGLKRKPKFREGYNFRAQVWEDRKEYEKAIADYSKAIEVEPGFAEDYQRRGEAYAKIKDYNKAIADMSEAMKLKPDEINYYIARGCAYNEIKEYNKALADFNYVLNSDPKRLFAYHHRGWSWMGLKEYAKAVADFDAAKGKMKYDSPENCYGRGMALYYSKDYSGAVDNFNEAIRMDPGLKDKIEPYLKAALEKK
jgi:tetratricopeptide (TPR) repeat protein